MANECNTENTQEQEINHLETLRFLKKQGYPMKRIRKSMLALLEIEQAWIAKALGYQTSISIRQTMSAAKYRHQVSLQEGISHIVGLPREEFFPEEHDGNKVVNQ